jgi:hypothetical protein
VWPRTTNCRGAHGAAAERALRQATQRAAINSLLPRALSVPPPDRLAPHCSPPQLCGALGAAEAPCPFFHRLSGPAYLDGCIAIDAVTYLHQERHECHPKVVQTDVVLPCKVRAATQRTSKTVFGMARSRRRSRRIECCSWSNNNNRGFSAILKVDHEGSPGGDMVAHGTSFFGQRAELVFVLTTERRSVSCRATCPNLLEADHPRSR